MQPCSFSKLELKSSLQCQVLVTRQEPGTTVGIMELLKSRSMQISKGGEGKIKTQEMNFCGQKFLKCHVNWCHLSQQFSLRCCSLANQTLLFLYNQHKQHFSQSFSFRFAHYSFVFFICLSIPFKLLAYSSDLFGLSPQ